MVFLDKPTCRSSTRTFGYTDCSQGFSVLSPSKHFRNRSNLVGTSFTRSFKSHDQLDFGPIRYSVVRYGRTQNYGQEVRVANNTKLHHVEIPIEELDGVYHYSVQTGNQSSKNATFKAYPKDELRVAVAADWQGLPDLNAIMKDDVHLLLTAGDNIKNIHEACGPGNKTCVEPYLQLIASYPTLFRSVPFMPVLGNHDKQEKAAH